jgi:hypothetical protein
MAIALLLAEDTILLNTVWYGPGSLCVQPPIASITLSPGFASFKEVTAVKESTLTSLATNDISETADALFLAYGNTHVHLRTMGIS